MAILGNNLLKQANSALQSRLPAGWSIKREALEPKIGAFSPDALIEVRGPDGKLAKVFVEAKKSVEPKDVKHLYEILKILKEFRRDSKNSYPLLVAPFFTPSTREKLRNAGINYLDLAGNSWIKIDRPGLYIETTGQEKNPWRQERPLRTLKGAVAERVVRALCDFFPPIGVRELADKAKADPGYVSRIIDLLEREDLITRKGRGPITKIDWQGLIRRWAQDYSPFERDRAFTYLEPRGLSALTDKLLKTKLRYAITTNMAASSVAPVAPPRLAVLYVDDPNEAASRLNLQPSESGANVMLALPFDEVVYQRTWQHNGLTFASLSQVAADLLKSPGRGPEEAEALLKYMTKNEKAWRS